MTSTIALNIVLDLAVFVAVVGGLAWAIWSDRPQRGQTRPAIPILRERRPSIEVQQTRSKPTGGAPPVTAAHAGR